MNVPQTNIDPWAIEVLIWKMFLYCIYKIRFVNNSNRGGIETLIQETNAYRKSETIK